MSMKHFINTFRDFFTGKKIHCVFLLLGFYQGVCWDEVTVLRDPQQPGGSFQNDNLDILLSNESGYSQVPFSLQDIYSAFSNMDFNSITTNSKLMPASGYVSSLDITVPNSFLAFYQNYYTANNLQVIENSHYAYIHSFGINNMGSNTSAFGTSQQFGEHPLGSTYGDQKSGAMAFTMKGFIWGYTNTYSPNISAQNKDRYVVRSTVHEIAHARGLKERGSYPVHYVHADANISDCEFCCMRNSLHYASNFAGNASFIYPIRFCDYHSWVIKDNLSDIIMQDLEMPNPGTICP